MAVPLMADPGRSIYVAMGRDNTYSRNEYEVTE
jgi:hypothetical protein